MSWLIAGTIGTAARGENEFGVQMDCAESSMINHEIPINFGVQTEKAAVSGPLAVISIPITRNRDQYFGCLEMYGKNTNVAKIAYFQELNRCRREASSEPSVWFSAKRDPSLTSGFDTEKFEECLHERDRRLDVELIEE